MDTIYMMLEKLIHDHSDQSEIIFDVSWALNYCQNDPSQRHIIFERGFHVFLAKHVRNGIVKNSKAALKALVVLSLAENSDIQKLIDTNIFDLCQELFELDEEFFKKESILILGNIALGEISQKVALIQHSVFEKILMQISKLSKLCAYEAFFLITHIVNTNNIDFLKMLFRAYPQILTVFMNSISDKTTDYTLIERQLDAVNLLLLMQKPLEVDISLMAEEIGVVDVLEALQYHESIKIYEMAGRIIEDHFSMDDNVENAQKFMELQSKMNEDSESRFNF
ncbi:MAG: Importin subunit alpha-1 [Paramarteilia canceri]